MTQLREIPHLFLCVVLLYQGTLQCSEFSCNHMAANLAKWWKTKFLNGYRQFTVVPTDCSDGRPSDTEELLGRNDYGTANEKDVCEEKQQQQQQQPNNAKNNAAPSSEKTQLNFEEFECDLSVEGGVDLGGQERQEFSFTLYDFDGHGKITKDDIAGLVTTIYDTLGSSIKVPHYGSKTIKVKLTVSPDQRKKDVAQDAAPMMGEETANNIKCNGTCPGSGEPTPPQGGSTHRVKFKRDLNVTIRESRIPRRLHRRRRCSGGGTIPVSEEKYANSCSSSCRSASENNDDGAADISEDDNDEDLIPEDLPMEREVGSQHSTPKASRESGRAHTRRYQQHTPSRYRHQHGVYCPGESNTPQLLRQRSKKRSSSLQREELLQIIQANMEKNNLSFQTSRKQCGDRGGLDHRHSHHRHRHKQQLHEDGMAAQVQLHCLASAGDYSNFSQDPRNNCYLDLAGFEPTRTLGKTQRCHFDPDCRYDRLLSTVMCASSKHTSYHQPCRTRGHHRSRSHDLSHAADSFQYHLLDPPTEPHHRPFVENGTPHGYHHTRLGHHARSKSHEAEYGNLEQQRTPVYRQQERKFPPIVIGHSSSPHHLKHRNREQDHARAMKQVVRWLEQEFSSSLNTTEKLNSSATVGPSANKTPLSTPSRNAKQSQNPNPGSPKKDEAPNSPSAASSVERHEHHHVHEHIHHHYHHYQETPVLV